MEKFKNPSNESSVHHNDSHELTEEEIRDFKLAFALIDKDGNGDIDARELGLIMKQFGQNLKMEELEEMINDGDKDGNGLIDFEEFLALMASKMNDVDTQEELIEAFRVFDRDGNGLIGHQELKYTMLNLGINVGSKEI